jgi:hypothetical protein
MTCFSFLLNPATVSFLGFAPNRSRGDRLQSHVELVANDRQPAIDQNAAVRRSNPSWLDAPCIKSFLECMMLVRPF